MTAETHLQGVEISAAQFFEIWHHYDSDGDSFPLPGVAGGGWRLAGVCEGEAGGPTTPWPPFHSRHGRTAGFQVGRGVREQLRRENTG